MPLPKFLTSITSRPTKAVKETVERKFRSKHKTNGNRDSVVYYVRVDHDTEMTGVDKEFWKQVNEHMSSYATTVKPVLDNEKWRDKAAITVVFCPVTSRLELNAKHAMKRATGHRKMALVFLHHVAKHVTLKTRSEMVLFDKEFHSLGTMVDVVFFQGQGMYDCQANKDAIEKFCTFLNSSAPVGSIIRDVPSRGIVYGCTSSDWKRERAGNKEQMDCHNTVVCYVRVEPDTEMMGVDKEFWKQVNEHMSPYSTTVSPVQDNEKWRDTAAITVVFCPVSSRLGSDAKHAMKGVTGHSKMALVFLHHVARHVPFMTRCEMVLFDKEFRSLGTMVDVVFFQGQGMYDCQANRDAIEKFCTFLNSSAPFGAPSSGMVDDRTSVDEKRKSAGDKEQVPSTAPGLVQSDAVVSKEESKQSTPSSMEAFKSNAGPVPQPLIGPLLQPLTDPLQMQSTSACKPNEGTGGEKLEVSKSICVKKSPGLRGADQELWQMVKDEWAKTQNSSLNIMEIEEMPTDQSVTFIECSISSSLVSDVNSALEGICSQKNMVLLVFHSIARHNTLTEHSTKLLCEQRRRDLGDIVDLVMWPAGDKRVYDCEINRKAVFHICNFIQVNAPCKD